MENMLVDRGKEAAATVMHNTGFACTSTQSGKTYLDLIAITNFLAFQCNGRFSAGLFNMDDIKGSMYGNLDVDLFLAEGLDGGVIEEDEDEEEEQEQENEQENEQDEPMGDLDESPLTEEEVVDPSDDFVSNIILSSEIDKLEGTLTREALWRLSSNVKEHIPFDEKKETQLLKDLTAAAAKVEANAAAEAAAAKEEGRPIKSNTLYCSFFCSNIEDTRLEEKFVDVMFLDGTFIAGSDLRTLLTLAVITTDHRTVPIAHMFHKGGEKTLETTFFLGLVKTQMKNITWKNFHIMCDQGLPLETAIFKVFGYEPLTCGLHLFKNVVKHTKGSVYAAFNTLCHTLDRQKQQEAHDDLISKFHQSSKKDHVRTFKKVDSELWKFTRLDKPFDFELQTTNAIEQIHSRMRFSKQGNIVNFISQLMTFQLHAINKLMDENSRDTPEFTAYGKIIISLQLGISTAFKVEPTSTGTFTVSYDRDRMYPIALVYEQYMRRLGRRKNYWKSRREYLRSLVECEALEVTDHSCSLCGNSKSYLHCPHVMAVRGHLYFRLEHLMMAETDTSIVYPHLNRLLGSRSFSDVVNLLGAHTALYHGYINDSDSDNEGRPINDAIPDPSEVNIFVASNVNWVLRKKDSGANHDTVGNLVGRKKDFVELAITRLRAEKLAEEEKERIQAAQKESELEGLIHEALQREQEKERKRQEKERKRQEKEQMRLEKEREKQEMKESKEREKQKLKEAKEKEKQEAAEKKKRDAAEKESMRNEEQEAERLQRETIKNQQKESAKKAEKLKCNERVSRDTMSSRHGIVTRGRSKYSKE